MGKAAQTTTQLLFHRCSWYFGMRQKYFMDTSYFAIQNILKNPMRFLKETQTFIFPFSKCVLVKNMILVQFGAMAWVFLRRQQFHPPLLCHSQCKCQHSGKGK